VRAIDHVLGKLGYAGLELEERPSRHSWYCSVAASYSKFFSTFYASAGTATTRDLALAVTKLKEKDLSDTRALNDLMNRVGKALGRLHDAGTGDFTKEAQRNSNVWRVAE